MPGRYFLRADLLIKLVERVSLRIGAHQLTPEDHLVHDSSTDCVFPRADVARIFREHDITDSTGQMCGQAVIHGVTQHSMAFFLQCSHWLHLICYDDARSSKASSVSPRSALTSLRIPSCTMLALAPSWLLNAVLVAMRSPGSPEFYDHSASSSLIDVLLTKGCQVSRKLLTRQECAE